MGEMITHNRIPEVNAPDAELVGRSLNGDRDAFGSIVARHQTLVCSLTYSICGDLQLSEDLAQDTFLAAWQQLRNLKEPEKLKSWLCGIARNLSQNALRQRHRVPTAVAEELEEDSLSSPLSPHDSAISREEAGMLWKMLEDLPPNYREPMVLYYREQESVSAVAEALDISEDAVKQRLVRGRAMLTEHIERSLRSALRGTAPGTAFTLGVLSALSLATSSAKAGVVGVATQSGAAKAGGSAMGTAILGRFASMIGLGGFVGWRMGLDAEQSAQGRSRVADFWRFFVISFPLYFISTAFLAATCFPVSSLPNAMDWCMGIYCLVVATAVLVWDWRRRKQRNAGDLEPTGAVARKLDVWVALAMTIVGVVLALALLIRFQNKRQAITAAEFKTIAIEQKLKSVTIWQHEDGSKEITFALPKTGSPYLTQRVRYRVPANESTLAILKENRIGFQTEMLIKHAWWANPALWLDWVLFFILASGAVLLLRRKQTARCALV